MYPVTIGGKVLGSVCAITGVILIAMPISLLANNFGNVYNSKNKKERIIKIHKERKKYT
jgi:ABC-type phosphate transport system permease subunit